MVSGCKEGTGESPGGLPATCGADWPLHGGPLLSADVSGLRLWGGGGIKPLFTYLSCF